MEYIDSVCSEMSSLWVPKLLMDLFLLNQHHECYDITKHVNQDYLYMVYFNPQKCPISNQFQGDRHDLLCKDLTTSAIKQGYQIVKNDSYSLGGLTANRFSCSRYIQFNGNINFCKLVYFCQKIFHDEA